MKSDKFAALTMVWRSYQFIEKWINYCSNEFGAENVFVIAHGQDEIISDITSKCNIITVPREFSGDFDKVRWMVISDQVAMILNFYEGVVVSDCDEFLVADPENFQYLQSALQHHHHKVTGFAGLNVFQGGNSHTYPID